MVDSPSKLTIIMEMFFSVSGLRGVVGRDLTADVVRKHLKGFYKAISGRRVGVGRDSRQDSEDLANLCIETLKSFGCDVFDIGITPTPTVLYIVRKEDLDGGIIVTASHNPYPYNGLKFVQRGGRFFFYSEIKGIPEGGDVPSGTGKVKKIEGGRIHVNEILKYPVIESDCGLRVGVDPVNGAGCEIIKRLLEQMECEVFAINDQPTGLFNRPPEPTRPALGALGHLVKEQRLDLGIALDPDGDRLSIVTENGEPIGEEYTLPIIGREYLRQKRGPVVVNLSTSRMIEAVVKEYNLPFYRTRVGEANVVEKMIEVDAVFGGEGNGGVIIPEFNLTRDAIFGAAFLLSILKRNQIRVSDLIQPLPRLVMRKERLSINMRHWKRLRNLIRREFIGDKDQRDGIWVSNERIWLHVRPSRTEPVIRLIVEGEEEGIVEDAIERISKIVRSLG
ncbi:MAG TPA: hypothetical protein EYP58_00635 [bacterium (Candidatus Stahlbacteria)]|nr:hypothetical protein [Candidatus Stahlbacteria bacterium]